MKFKKPITEFTFQDAEYLTVKISELIKSFITLVGNFINGFKTGKAYTFDEEETAE
ncbi:MAG: hypothetical protein IKN72_01715 [Clostridia bacterium]|nr:hypothetical protein [Clostridia bacterium]MBR3552085.1 hypothetical protein [Clostridia bacterium]